MSTLKRATSGRWKAAAGLAGLLLACWAGGSGARADNIDEKLVVEAPKLMQEIYHRGYKNVGVLSFRLEKGQSRPTFHGGMIVTNMADRLQDALVLALNPEKPAVGVADGCSAVAGRSIAKASYRMPDDRRRLLALKYPLAWGNPPQWVTVDAFLTGKVQVSPDLRKTTVYVEMFDRKNPASMTLLAEFTVKTDHVILADIGQGYVVSRGRLKFGRSDTAYVPPGSESGRDNPGTNPNPNPNPNPNATPGGSGSDGSDGGQLGFAILYDGVQQKMEPDSASGPMNFTIPDPKPGQKVTFGLKNNSSGIIGVLLVVNDTNTLYEEKSQPDQMSPWILEPNKDYVVKGYYLRDNETYNPIVGLSDADSAARSSELGGSSLAGIITVYVVTPGASGPSSSTPGESAAPNVSRSLRRPSPQFLPHGRPRTPADAANAIMRSGIARSERGLMAKDPSNPQQEKLNTRDFHKGTVEKCMIIKYWKQNSPGNT
jgi:hypothetical protein